MWTLVKQAPEGMANILKLALALAGCLLAAPQLYGQSPTGEVPATPSSTWRPSRTEEYQSYLRRHPRSYQATDPNKTYALYELIDIAEEQNPTSRIVWEQLKQQAAALGIARSALYPTLSINVPTREARDFLVFPYVLGPVIGGATLREDTTVVNPVAALNYLVFDFGGRNADIGSAAANLFVSGTTLNETHEEIALNVSTSYYRVVSSSGLEESARASLKDAELTEQQVQDQFNRGLATLPNLLSAQAQQQQAEYNLESATGNKETAESDLARSVGLNPAVPVLVKGISEMPRQTELEGSVEQLISRALVQRPDLLEAVGRIRAADAQIKAARAALYPSLNLQLEAGYDSQHTSTSAGPAPYLHQANWQGQLSISWTVFDARRRRYQIIQAESEKRAAEAQLDSARDQAANLVWSSYVAAKIAFRRLETSNVLLTSAQTSYDAAQASFEHGLATYVDVLNAEEALAQARNEQVQAASQILTDLAQLAYQTGDLLGSRFLRANRNAK